MYKENVTRKEPYALLSHVEVVSPSKSSAD